jgi:membrane protein YqaA with SNARE-associated domain
MKRADRLLLLSIVLLAVYFLLSLIIPDFLSPVVVVYGWLLQISLLMGYGGDFIIAVLGNSTVLFPIPYMGVTFILGGLRDGINGPFLFNPWLVGLIAGFGATLGEMVSYLVGYGGGQLIEEKQRNSFLEYVTAHPEATPLMLWFLAATPIPDDILIVPLGAAKYPWWKVAIPQLIGKSMFMIVIAWAGRFGLEIIGLLFGNTDSSSIISRSIEVGTLFFIILSIYLVVKIDWNRLVTKPEMEGVDNH